MTSNIINLTKVDSARRQLAEAIRLFFDRRDPVAIHTLAAAAREVIHDVAKSKGLESILQSGIEQLPTDKREYYMRTLRSTQNFLKHADKHPDEIHVFRPEETEYFIFDAVDTYRRLADAMFPEGEVFAKWFHLKNPFCVLDTAYHDSLLLLRVTPIHLGGIDINDFDMFRKFLDTTLPAPAH
jgi:hypothetical protein